MAMHGSTKGSPVGSPQEQHYHDTMTKDQMSAIRALSDLQHDTFHVDLTSSTLLSYLDLDERPSFAVHVGSNPLPDVPLELVYSNSALRTVEDLSTKVAGQQNPSRFFVDSVALHLAFRNWLLGVFDESDPARRGNSYLYEGYVWTAVTVQHYKVVSGLLARMMWSQVPTNAKSRPQLDPKESGSPKFLPQSLYVPTELPLLKPSGAHTDLDSLAVDTSPPMAKQHGPYDYTLHPPPVAAMSDHVKYFRETDWSQTPLGPTASWSPELRSVVNMALNDSYPAVLFWGEDAIMIYNEAYVHVIGVLHPCMGKSARTYASDYWPTLQPLVDHINASGSSVREHNVPLFIDRHGFLEETYWSFQFTPVLNSEGHITSYYHDLYETTEHHLLERRVSSLVELGSQTANARDFQALWDSAVQTLMLNSKDVPFALLYSAEHQYGSEISCISSPGVTAPAGVGSCVLKGSIGVDAGHTLAPPTINLHDSSYVFHSYLVEAARLGKATVVHLADIELDESVLASVDWKGYGEPCRILLICPIMPTTGEQVEGFVILGVNPRRPFDDDYQRFVHVMLRLLATSLASVALFDAEVRQKEKAIGQAALLQEQLMAEIKLKEKKFQR
jgi:hypothetical protein